MTTMAKLSKTIKKLDKPRPLKVNKLIDKTQSAEEIINLADACSQQIQSHHLDSTIAIQINTLWNSLKTFGPQLEHLYKDRLDRAFVVFRNGSRDERLDPRSRLSLLELIELRAFNWMSTEYMTSFYKQRQMTQMEELPLEAVTSPSPTTPTMLGLPPGSLLQATVQTPPMLSPGEVIKASGKFSKPTKIPGKNYSKDEVIIRNSDSGKVMGIKGRRVHMIEELSETIISFQRVNPGARERLVQITGPNEEKISYAKQLIEDTIRRNASPVREIPDKERICGSSSSLNSSASDDETFNHSGNRNLQHSHSANSNLEFKYTVNVGKQMIKIIGNDYNIVKIAKVILDEHLISEVQKSKDSLDDYASVINFEEDIFTNHDDYKEETKNNDDSLYLKEKDMNIRASSEGMALRGGGASALGRSLLLASVQSPPKSTSEPKQLHIPRIDYAQNQEQMKNDNVILKDPKSRRNLFPANTPVKKFLYVYSSEQLMEFSEHPICKRQPENWLKIISEIPEISRKVKKNRPNEIGRRQGYEWMNSMQVNDEGCMPHY